MAQDLISELNSDPQKVFELFGEKNGENSDYFKKLTKVYLDPISKDHSVLDQIHIDGLDATQIYAQAKIVTENVGEALIAREIPEIKESILDGESDLKSGRQDHFDTDDTFASEHEEELELGDENSGDEDGAVQEEISQEESDVGLNLSESEFEDQAISDSESINTRENAEFSVSETKVASDDEVLQSKKDVFGLNDGFFDIDEFNKQVLALEDDNNDADDEDIDYFNEVDEEDEDEENMDYYDDFFSKPGVTEGSGKKSSQNSTLFKQTETENFEEEDFGEKDYENAVDSAMLDLFADEHSKEEAKQSTNGNLSSFQKQQQQIQKEIANLEAELVAEKKWAMKGEISAKQRPQDSLLDDPESAELEFDRTAKPVPVITEEVTESIEDLIKRRIKGEEFDDLPKRVFNDVSKFTAKPRADVSEEKSKKSLAEIYEDLYNKVDESQEVSEEIKKQHDEISQLFASVNHKLDSLCSAHFIPKPHQAKSIEIKVSEAASINMEDAQPVHVESEATLAPQEIYKVGDDVSRANGAKGKSQVTLKSGLSYSKDELSREDKQRLRRANKRKKARDYNRKREHSQATNSLASASKKPRVGEIANTISNAKNITIIGKKGEKRDVKGNIKKSAVPSGSSNFML